jgi:hypothetical protein
MERGGLALALLEYVRLHGKGLDRIPQRVDRHIGEERQAPLLSVVGNESDAVRLRLQSTREPHSDERLRIQVLPPGCGHCQAVPQFPCQASPVPATSSPQTVPLPPLRTSAAPASRNLFLQAKNCPLFRRRSRQKTATL